MGQTAGDRSSPGPARVRRAVAPRLLVALVLVGVAVCSVMAAAAPHAISAPMLGLGPRQGGDQPGQRLPTRGPIGKDPSVRKTVPLNLVGGLIAGTPIMRGDFADPFVLAEPTDIYAYATNTVDANVPVIEIQKGDVLNGKYLGDALPTLPSWTAKGFQWAPSVWARPDGRFVLYYSTPAPPPAPGQPRRQCISRAVATAPAGPFTDDSASPFICPVDQGGAIDPSIFVDGTTPYLLWKSDGNCCGLPTDIYSQELTPDGLSIAGPANRLITNDQPWEGSVVEGPSMVKAGADYELFYSANDWDSANYAVGIALCTSVEGPCTKPLNHPWMKSAQGYSGPGGQEFFSNPGGVWMVHHGFLPGEAGKPDGERRLYLDLLEYQGTNPIPTRVGAQEALGKVLQLALVVVGALLAAGLGAFALFRLRRRRGRAITNSSP
jgi:Glycosyl hydrolases family 43